MRWLAACFVSLLAAQALSQPQYEVVDLTAVYGQGFEAVSINDSGVIGGNFVGRACIAYDGKLTMLPKWKGGDWTLQDFGNNGHAMGWGINTGSGIPSVYYDAGKGTVMDMGIPGAPANGRVFGINNVGQATGQLIDNLLGYAFVWEDGAVQQVLKPIGAGLEMNDNSTVVGHGGSGQFAAMWVDGTYKSLHAAWAETSEAVAVNELDEAVGTAWAPGIGFRALLWRDGITVDLGDLGGGANAYDINDNTQAVGLAVGHGPSEGYLWENGAMHRLEDLVTGGTGFVVINAATSVNNSGQILATGFTGSSNNSLLFNPVPEPNSATALAIITSLIGMRTICRKKRLGRKK